MFKKIINKISSSLQLFIKLNMNNTNERDSGAKNERCSFVEEIAFTSNNEIAVLFIKNIVKLIFKM